MDHSCSPGQTVGKLLMWQMKLSNTTQNSAVPVLQNVHHKMAARGFTDYIAVVYNCQRLADINVAELPKNSISVPFETLHAILAPFGASYIASRIADG